MQTFIFFFGPPGSGKGTQAEMFSEKTKIPILSTGKLLREIQNEPSEFGKKIKKKLEKGEYVSDYIIEKLIEKALENDKYKKGAIFDGYPRNKAQLNSMRKRLKKILGEQVLAILINVCDKEILHRLKLRRVCKCSSTYHLDYNPPKIKGICDDCKHRLFIRSDDKPKIIKERILFFKHRISHIEEYWKRRGKLIIINGEQGISDIHKEIMEKAKEIIKN